MPGYIHHVQWSVASVADTAAKLGREYGMRVVAARSLPDSGEREVVLRSGAVTFLVSPARPALVTRPAPGRCEGVPAHHGHCGGLAAAPPRHRGAQLRAPAHGDGVVGEVARAPAPVCAVPPAPHRQEPQRAGAGARAEHGDVVRLALGSLQQQQRLAALPRHHQRAVGGGGLPAVTGTRHTPWVGVVSSS